MNELSCGSLLIAVMLHTRAHTMNIIIVAVTVWKKRSIYAHAHDS